jgi:hypothetical protein
MQGIKNMSEPTTPPMLILPCKDCHQPVSDSETNAYRLIAGILYGWCNECFNRHQRFLKFGQPPVQSVAAVAVLGPKG